MVGTKQEVYDLCKIEGFSDTLRIINQMYSYKMQINNLEYILMDFSSLDDEDEMVIDIKQQIKFYKNILERFKECYMKRIQKLIDQNYDQEIIDKFIAICNDEFYIEVKNKHAMEEDYIANYDELTAKNKVKLKQLKDKALKER